MFLFLYSRLALIQCCMLQLPSMSCINLRSIHSVYTDTIAFDIIQDYSVRSNVLYRLQSRNILRQLQREREREREKFQCSYFCQAPVFCHVLSSVCCDWLIYQQSSSLAFGNHQWKNTGLFHQNAYVLYAAVRSSKAIQRAPVFCHVLSLVCCDWLFFLLLRMRSAN